MPERIAPMLARTGPLPPDDGRWAYEIKWDGVRAIAFVEGGRLRLQARTGRDITPRYPELRPLGRGARRARGRARRRGRGLRRRAAELPEAPGPHAPDLRARGPAARAVRPGALHRLRPALPRRPLAAGAALRRAPRALAGLELAGPTWQAPAHHVGDGAALLELTRAQQLEGIIAKRLDGTVHARAAARAGWVKVKNICSTDAVVGGWLAGEGGRTGRLGALVIGDPRRRRRAALRRPRRHGLHRGRAGAPGPAARAARARRTARSPAPSRRSSTHFVEPRLVARVDYTRADAHRHAAPAVLQGPARRRGARRRAARVEGVG